MIVDVWDLKGKYLGTGNQERVYGDDLPEWATELQRIIGHPQITLSDGKTLFGVECWWKEKEESPPEQLDFKPLQDMVKSINETKERSQT